ncbi:MAG: filamentous hemagglutinin N-terminal domain-containing protein [Nostocaceae cyanobacterium]|nr:filamentous hemagglutinin N-terminal domain-containing protein [Nostocaceae cyanobacterium]
MRSIYCLGLLGIALLQGFSIKTCFAQSSNIVPDNTLGDERSKTIPLDASGFPVDVIDGGAIRSANLFHSFAEFNVAELRGVYFLNPSNDIQNILARVTGNNPSEILGTLGILNDVGITSSPDLFLINPNGILFGESASLDVGSSFVATTANGINLGETGLFSATEPQKSNLLSVNPSALFFNAVNNQAEIVNRSTATSTVLGFALNGDANRPINGLRVLDGKSLLLVGGNVSLEGGQILAPSGRIELGSIAGIGSVSFNQTEKGLALGYDNVNNFGDIKLSTFAFVSGNGESGGHIQIQGKQLLLDISSIISTGANLPNDGGEISIRTTDSVIVNDSVIGSFATENSGSIGDINIDTKKLDVIGGIFPFAGLISTTTIGEKKAGDINIKAETVSLRDGGEISASTNAKGDAGNITINASESVEVIGDNKNDFSLFEEILGSVPDNLLSKIASQVNRNATGKGGNILINTKRLTVKDGAQIQAGTFSEVSTGKGGILNVNASESVEISGTDGDGSPSGLFTATIGAAEANDLTINTGKLSIFNGGTVSASTAGLFGEGKSGNLTINATDYVEVNGFLEEDKDGTFFSSIVAETGRLLSTNTGINPAPGGNLTINTQKLKISDGGRVSSATYGLAGKAGDLTLNATESVEVVGDRSFITAGTNATGDAGDLRIRTQKLTIREGAEVSTTTSGNNQALRIRNKGQGGILDVDASEFVEVSGVNSGLVSFSLLSTGDAGKIKLNTSRLFIRDGGTVSTSSMGRGRGGDLEINASDFIEISGSGTSFIRDLAFPREVRRKQITTGSSLSSLTISTKNSGDITINTGQLFVRDGGEIIANTLGLGKGGNVQIRANSVFLEKNASISSNSGSEQSNPQIKFGDAGDIFIDVRNNLQANNSTISTTAATSSGGAINITAKNIRLLGNSDISTNVFSGTGGGGNITLTANTIIALDDSDILSFASDGKGGDITFNTAGFFSTPLYSPTSPTTDANALAALDGNNRVDVNASGAVSGAITGVPDITFIDENLTDLPAKQIDTDTLIANSCIARSTQRQENSFTITGSGGLRNNPGDELVSIYSTGEVRNVKTTPRPWKKGDLIIEPTGVYKLPDGRLILGRICE